MRTIYRLNLTTGEATKEEAPPRYAKLGGRALTAAVLLDEVDPAAHPLGPKNKIVIAPGLLGGTPVPNSGRLSIGGKSPLTGGIKESNAGGTAADRLARLGIKALIIEGQAPGKTYIARVTKEGVEFIPAPQLAGKGNYETAGLLRNRYGPRASLITVGPAGERGYAAAGIAVTDLEGRPSRMCGRGGLGAVLGKKGLKALVIEAPGAPLRSTARKDLFQETLRKCREIILASPATASYADYGTAAMVDVMNEMGGLPTRNFSRGRFAEAGRINAARLRENILSRGGAGKPTHPCMANCLVKCSNVYPDETGKEIVSPLEYETIGLLGANLGIADLDAIAALNHRCNDLGIDTIETGGALGVAMAAGLAAFGDTQAAFSLLDEIAGGTVLGRVLGQGAMVTGRVFGVARVAAVKGQGLPAYDPRALKGVGVTYATSPQGADHTAGQTVRAKVDHRRPEGQVDVSWNAQVNFAVFDALGLCMFVIPSLVAHPEVLADLVAHFSGRDFTAEDLRELGRQVIRTEREFNARAGFTRAHNRLPEFFREEILPDTQTVFDVPEEELDTLEGR